MKLGSVLVVLALCGACGDDPTYAVSGDAFLFNGGTGLDGRLAGATVSLVEDPARTVVTATDGHFVLDGFAADAQVTLALEMPNYHRIQTSTLTLADADAERVTFQVVHDAIYVQLAQMLQVTPDDGRCQIVTTVTRVGKSLYDEGAHGEGGAVVQLAPAPAQGAEGPIYFDASVLPDRSLTQTTEDGGVLFVNVPPGDYWLSASKAGVSFRAVQIKCRAGWLVNASPPWGLQAL